MKKLTLIISAFFVAANFLSAQTPQEKFEQNLPDSVKYYLPKFDQGRIVYSDGGFSGGTFNVGTLDQTIRFVSEDKSILALSNMSQVDRVTIGGVLFLRNGSSMIAIVDSKDDVLFGVTKRLEIDNFAKKGAYGTESQTTSVTTYGSIQATGTIYNLETGGKYKVKEYPYIYRKNAAHVASKNIFLKSFPNNKEEITKYLEENKVDFSNVADVTALFVYIKSL